MLLATINRLSGRDDLGLRARLLEALRVKIGDNKLLKAVPETPERLDRVLSLNRLPEVPDVLPAVLEAMTFFVSRDQKAVINAALAKVGGKDRAETLVAILKNFLTGLTG